MPPAASGNTAPMRVVITGATGNVGTSLVEALVDEPAVDHIVGVARRRPRWSPPKTTWVTADVSEDDLASIVEGADVVVHLAWLFQPTHQPVTTWRANVLGSLRVFEAAATAGVGALVHASSVGTYAPGPADDAPVDESWPTHALPTAAYGREKSYVERLLDVVERDHPDLRVVRLRPAFTFRTEASPEQQRIFAGPLLPGRLVGHRWVPVIPDVPRLRFQALHGDDVADAYRRAVLQPVRGAFNVAAEPVLDARALGDIFGSPVVPVPTWAARSALAAAWHLRLVPASPTLLDLFLSLPVLDTTRARTELGWTPRHSSRAAIESFLHGLRHPEGMATPPLDPDQATSPTDAPGIAG